MHSPSESFTIGALAEAAKVNVETIRFYQRRGLMFEPERPTGGIRRYMHDDLSRVHFIKGAQRLGFSLVEVSELLKLEDGSHCVEARRKGELKLADVRAKLANLRRIETALAELVKRCDKVRGQVRCPLIATLKDGDARPEVMKSRIGNAIQH